MSFASVARFVARQLAWPVRRLARHRDPAVVDPARCAPGDAPPTDGRLLILFDGGCGICLHGRDLLAAWDRDGSRLAFDRIARHHAGLLRDVPAAERYESWHVIGPDGRLLSGAAGVVPVLGALPCGRPLAGLARRFPSATDRAYRWFARNRGQISRAAGLIDHPQRDPREQPDHPEFAAHLLALRAESAERRD